MKNTNSNNDKDDQEPGLNTPGTNSSHPTTSDLSANNGNELAANLIRKKVEAIYSKEPDAKKEIHEAEIIKPRSKHQQFIYDLQQSGKSMPEIQLAWHNYYLALPDEEKHQVWQEFYDANIHTNAQPLAEKINSYNASDSIHKPFIYNEETGNMNAGLNPAIAETRPHQPLISPHETTASSDTLKQQLRKKVEQRRHLTLRHHLKSLAFGLAMGSLAIVIFLFSFFNQVIIAPFIQPSRNMGSTPLIVDASSITATNTPEVIIPKINVEIPVNYSLTTDNENVIETALESGVVHYASTVVPGQNGNVAIFGHSSNNIFNPGRYKFAFVLLHTLVKGDTFYLTYNKTVYVYQVIDTRIVPPSDVAVLNDTEGKQATATLITCDPPGTSLNRLVVTGEQISPSPSTNTSPVQTPTTVSQPAQIASNGPSLWSRLWHSIF